MGISENVARAVWPFDSAFLDLLPAGLYVCDRDGHIRYFNRRAAELWGREPRLGDTDERFCGAFRLYFLDGAPMAHAATPMADALRSGTPQRNMEAVIERPGGERITALVNIDPLYDAAGNLTGAVNVFQDITEKKRAHEALREADRKKDEFLATLAHELRNPLAPLANALEILRLDPNKPRVDKIRDMMERQVTHMTRLVDDLLDVARITRGTIELRTEDVLLADVVRSALETSKPWIDRGRHELRVSLPKTDVLLEADPARLSQVLSNLVNNAAKFTPPGGCIEVRAERQGSRLVVDVSDNGMGMSPEFTERAFDMYVRAEGTNVAGGIGIGLPLARRLVEMHGGTLDGRSSGVGQGSVFTVVLPLAARGAPSPQLRAELDTEAEGLAARRILVVDDNADSADSLGVLLTALGHDLRIAHHGTEALEIARAFSPEIVFLDLGMPDLDGFEVAERLARDTQADDLRPTLVALTGWGQEADRTRSRAAGFDHHLTKPVRLELITPLLLGSSSPERCAAVTRGAAARQGAAATQTIARKS